jgi:hypothetical protein
MSNIRLDRSNYKVDLAWLPRDHGFTRSQDKWEVLQDVQPHKLGIFDSREEAEAFIVRRCSPVEERPRIYSDICRCGKCGPAWDYILCADLVFERCTNCKMPMRHDVMLALNKPLMQDFDLDDFLNM